MKIKLTDKVSIDNPLKRSDIMSFEGNIEDIDLGRQKSNYNKILDKLQPFGIYFDHIWYAKFTREVYRKNYEVSHFVAKSNCGNIYWRKYEGQTGGSGNNFIYIKGKKYSTSSFLNYKHERIENLLN